MTARSGLRSEGSDSDGKGIYIERPCDSAFLSALRQGTYCLVMAPQAIGKTRLRHRTMMQLRQLGIDCVSIDLSGVAISKRSATGVLGAISNQILGDYELKKPPEWWAEDPGCSPEQRWIQLLRWVADQRQRPIVLLIDEVNVLAKNRRFDLDAFVAVVRSALNQRPVFPSLSAITIALFGTLQPSIILRSAQQTPFNFGCSIELTDFSAQEMMGFSPLLQEHKLPAEAILEAVFAWTSGHPRMTRELLARLLRDHRSTGAARVSPEESVKQCVIDIYLHPTDGIGDDSMVRIENYLGRRHRDVYVAPLLDLYARLVSGEQVPAQAHDSAHLALRMAGLATIEHGSSPPLLRVRNQILATRFDAAWIDRKRRERKFGDPFLRWKTADQAEALLLGGVQLREATVWAEAQEDLTPDETSYLLRSARTEITQLHQSCEELREQAARTADSYKNAERQCTETRSQAARWRRYAWVGGITSTLSLTVFIASMLGGQGVRSTQRQQQPQPIEVSMSSGLPVGSEFPRVVSASDMVSAVWADTEDVRRRTDARHSTKADGEAHGPPRRQTHGSLASELPQGRPDGRPSIRVGGNPSLPDVQLPAASPLTTEQRQLLELLQNGPSLRKMETDPEGTSLVPLARAFERAAVAQNRFILQNSSEPATIATINSEGKLLALGGKFGTLTIWDALADETQPTFELPTPMGSSEAIAFSPSGDSVAMAGELPGVELVAVQSRTSRQLTCGTCQIDGMIPLIWSQNGRWLVGVTRQRQVVRWDLSAQALRTAEWLDIGTTRAEGVEFVDHDRWLVVETGRYVRVFDTTTNRHTDIPTTPKQPSGPDRWVSAFHGDRIYVAGKYKRGALAAFSPATGAELATYSERPPCGGQTLLELLVSGDGRYLTAICRDTTLRQWDTQQGRMAPHSIPLADVPREGAIAAMGSLVAIGTHGRENILHIIDVNQEREVIQMVRPRGPMGWLAFDGSGDFVFSRDNDGKVWIDPVSARGLRRAACSLLPLSARPLAQCGSSTATR